MTLEEIRAKYPQYKDVPDVDLARALHAKFYSDVPVAEFNARIGLKPTAMQTFMGGGPVSSAIDPGGLIKGATDAMGNIEEGIPRGLAYVASLGGNLKGGISDALNSLADAASANNKRADKSYEDARFASGAQGFDASRLAGNLGSPVNFVGGRVAAEIPEATTLLGKMLQSGGFGGLFGAATSPEGHRGEGAAIGGIGGAALPALLTGLGTIASPVINRVSQAFSPTAQKSRAAQEILKHVQADTEVGGPSLDAMKQRLIDAARNGQPLNLADVAGETVRGLGEGIVNEPGPGRQVGASLLNARDEAAQQGALGDLSMVSPNASKFNTLEALTRQRAAQSEAPYQEALDAKQVWSPRLEQFTGDKLFRAGLSKGIELQRLDALEKGSPFDPNDYAITGFNEAGDPVISGVPNMRTLDAAKKGLDAIVKENVEPNGRLNTYGRAVNGVVKAYVKELDSLNPKYATARQAWASPSQQMDAVQNGAKLFAKDPEQIAAEMDRLNDAERDMYRVGAASAIRNRILGTRDSANEANRVAGTELDRQRIRAMIGDSDKADKYLSALENRTAAFKTKADMLGNSRTALRQAAQGVNNKADNRLTALEVAGGLVTGNPLLTAAGVARGARPIYNVLTRPNAATKAEIASMLFQTRADPLATVNQLEVPPMLPGTQFKSALRNAPVSQSLIPLLSLLSNGGSVQQGN